MKKFCLLVSLALIFQPCLASDEFTLYLVRHAEKQIDIKNPPLTQCGKERARQLAILLSEAKIKSIYSTSYQRTMSTAAPLANQQQLAIKNYNPKQLKQVSLQLKQNKQNALIVGHSNTTSQLAHLLSDKKTEPLTEQDYQELYQVQFNGEQISLTKLMQPHVCSTKK